MTMLRREAPELLPTADLAAARHTLESYSPEDPDQHEMRRRTLELIARHPDDAHLRSSLEGHLTASALVVSPDGARVLLTHHKKLDRWLQLGGHCDGDANLPGVALREALEEGGIVDLEIDPRVIDVDIHPIPARGEVPEHLHYDTRFLVRARRNAAPVVSEESNDVRWLGAEEALEQVEDGSLQRLLRWWIGRR